MLAASLEWPLALRMALKVSTREDLTAGSDESQSRPLTCTRLVSAGLDLPRTGEPGLLGLGASALETMMLPVAVERSVSPALLVIERSSAELAGPSWMAGRRTRGPSPCPRAWTWHLSTPPWGPDMAIRTWRVVCWRMSQTYRSVVRPTWQTLIVDSPWPSSTPWSESGLLKVLSAVPGPETDALMGELRSLLECNAHPVLDDAGGPAVAQQTPPVWGKVCQASPHLGPVNVSWLRKKKKTCHTSCFLGRVVDGPFRRQLERAAPVWPSSALWMEGSPACQTRKA